MGNLPALGQTDVTLEATVYGAILGLRAMALILCGALYTAAIDPDEVLRLFRRLSFRSALTATLATRMVPVLLRDSHRLADAQRCRPGRPPSRLTLIRAASGGVLDRALDVAAALEVRGLRVHRRPRQGVPAGRTPATTSTSPPPAIALVAIAIGARVGGQAPFEAYPALHSPADAGVLGTAAAVLLCALLPFADRRGIGR